jgi:DNA repair exonuclease SbcCD ATPase subunit
MSTQPKPGQKPGAAPAEGLFRRRVVFELTSEQLPLLEAAEDRHGSKRSALVAALEAEERIGELETTLAKVEAELDTSAKRTKRAQAGDDKERAQLERTLKDAEAKLVRLEAELVRAHGEGSQTRNEHARAQDELLETIEAYDEQIAELEERAVDSLYCARCGKWAPAAEWAWQDEQRGGEYAHHGPCGDHAPGILGGSSWLAYRLPAD